MTEKSIENKIRRELEKRGWLVWKLHGSPFTPAGRPDLLAFKFGRTLAIEVKTPKGVTSHAQGRVINQLRGHGIAAIVARSWDDVDRAINNTFDPIGPSVEHRYGSFSVASIEYTSEDES